MVSTKSVMLRFCLEICGRRTMSMYQKSSPFRFSAVRSMSSWTACSAIVNYDGAVTRSSCRVLFGLRGEHGNGDGPVTVQLGVEVGFVQSAIPD